MPGSASYAILLLGTLLEALVVVCAVRRKVLRKYFVLNLYMLLCVFVSFGRYHVMTHDGVSSLTYRYFYFYSDALLTIVLYFGLISLYISVFEEMKVERYLRIGRDRPAGWNLLVHLRGCQPILSPHADLFRI